MNLTTELPQLLMGKVIVHYIPKHKKNEFDKPVRYSKKVTDLTDGLKTFFKKKIIEALNSDRAFKICYDSTSDSPVPSLVKTFLGDDKTDFIETSKKITDRLYKVQTGTNPSGIVLLITGNIKDINVLSVMKLEPDSGAQMTFDDAAESIDIQEVENLMLTQRTKFFKIAMLFHSKKKRENYNGVLMDFQINIQSKIRIESFFLDDFLGCRAYKDPRTITKTFYELTRTFINGVDDAILKTKYLNDLNSYVQSNRNVLSPKVFSDEYLQKVEHKQNYKEHLERNRFPFEPFQKNIQYIQRKLNKITIEFDNDVSIIAKQGDIGKKIKLAEIKEGVNKGKHKAEIVARIKKVS